MNIIVNHQPVQQRQIMILSINYYSSGSSRRVCLRFGLKRRHRSWILSIPAGQQRRCHALYLWTSIATELRWCNNGNNSSIYDHCRFIHAFIHSALRLSTLILSVDCVTKGKLLLFLPIKLSSSVVLFLFQCLKTTIAGELHLLRFLCTLPGTLAVRSEHYTKCSLCFIVCFIP